MATRKVTFTLAEETAARIDRLAERLRIPKSRVVREAVQEYAGAGQRLSEEERNRMLAALDTYYATAPAGPPGKADAELAELRRARRSGGRRMGRGV